MKYQAPWIIKFRKFIIFIVSCNTVVIMSLDAWVAPVDNLIKFNEIFKFHVSVMNAY